MSPDWAKLLEITSSAQFAHLPPSQIVPMLADEGLYFASESTFYRVLRDARQLKHRRAERPAKPRFKPRALCATAPNQLYSWDITYLPSRIKGQYFYLYLFLDIFSRKIVGWQVYAEESAQLACALSHHYCQQGMSVFYFRLKQLLAQMYLAQAEGSYRKLLDKLANCSLLLLDDWALEPLNPQQRGDLLALIEARYDRTSTLITSQLPVANWYQMIGESTHADAILDRLLHPAIKLELKGESMRKSMNKLTQGDHSG